MINMAVAENRACPQKAILRGAEFFFFGASVLLWFKGNFPALRGLGISPLIPLAGLAVLLSLRAAGAFRRGGLASRFRIRRAWAAPILIILLATLVRIPFLLHPAGLVDSDEAISLLQGKHIAEGKVPPIYYYGADYQGTPSQHVTALAFFLFGYSPLLAKIVGLLFYLAFLAVQYAFLKELFSAAFAFWAGLILALPLNYLIHASLEIASAFGLIFLLSSLILYLTLRVSRDGRERLTGPLGFIMGIAFWTHPMSAITIIAAGIVLAFRFRLRLKPYAVLGAYFLLGMIPVLFAEAFGGFPLIPVLTSGETAWVISGEKLLRMGRLLQMMLFSKAGAVAFAGLIWFGGGAVVLSVHAVKRRDRRFALVFPLFALVYFAFYLLSGWSVTDVVRYLYLLIIAVPVLLLAPLLLVRSRILSGLFALVLAGVLVGANLPSAREYQRSALRAERIYEETIDAMEVTGVRFWSAEYWRAYALTALSGERLIVSSFTMNRYLPYSLAFDNAGQGDNYVFMGEDNSPNDLVSRNLEALLTRLDIPFQKTSLGEVSLFYRIESDVFPSVLKENPPKNIPRFEIDDLQFEGGRLRLAVRFPVPVESDRFRLVLEIPDYNIKKYRLAKGQDRIAVALSHPADRPFKLRCLADFGGLQIDSTLREIDLSPPVYPDPQAGGTIFFLRGFSPEIESGDRRIRYCGPDAVFRIAPPPHGGETRLRLHLESPFQFFRGPWHGEYHQTVVFQSNGKRLLRRDLRDGMNIIDLVLPASAQAGPTEIVMTSSWQAWFAFAPFRRLSAVLEKIEFIEPGSSRPDR